MNIKGTQGAGQYQRVVTEEVKPKEQNSGSFANGIKVNWKVTSILERLGNTALGRFLGFGKKLQAEYKEQAIDWIANHFKIGEIGLTQDVAKRIINDVLKGDDRESRTLDRKISQLQDVKLEDVAKLSARVINRFEDERPEEVATEEVATKTPEDTSVGLAKSDIMKEANANEEVEKQKSVLEDIKREKGPLDTKIQRSKPKFTGRRAPTRKPAE